MNKEVSNYKSTLSHYKVEKNKSNTKERSHFHHFLPSIKEKRTQVGSEKGKNSPILKTNVCNTGCK